MLSGHLEEPTDGTNLRRYIKSRGILPVERAVSIAHDAALALGEAHQRGIVHGNINQQTIVVRRNGTAELIGFSLQGSMNLILKAGVYCSPEQAKGEEVTPATDVYSLGVVLYEMLTGCKPFTEETFISAGVEAVIFRCLDREPDNRFHDGLALARALENLAI